ncbi:porin, partial [Roseiarcus fermentans]
MTLMKSILLGSAAAIVAVAGAQAADLPTRKAAPVEQYVKICNVGGITGWTLPGSDTCVKFSGYITAQIEGGNLSTQYNQGGYSSVYNAYVGGGGSDPTTLARLATGVVSTGGTITGGTASGGASSQRVLIAGSRSQGNDTWSRNAIGWTTRANIGFDMASNTAYGPLIGHVDLNANMGSGFDNTGSSVLVNNAYVTWAGITAGVASSFYSFVGGGDNWANMFSPDRKGSNEPNLLAYTASFGGGFSATLSLESQNASGTGGGTNFAPPGGTFGGTRWPDIVGQLHVTQGWGEAQLSGVLHNVNVSYNSLYGTNGVAGCGVGALIVNCNSSQNKVGWGIDAGVKFNLPSFGPGDTFLLTGSYTRNAVWYSGLPDAMWGENGQVNGNGQAMAMYDT